MLIFPMRRVANVTLPALLCSALLFGVVHAQTPMQRARRHVVPGSGQTLRHRGEHRGPKGAAGTRDRSAAPGKIGGYRPHAISGAHRRWLVERCKAADYTLAVWWRSWPNAASRWTTV
jgi:hypothetical protein